MNLKPLSNRLIVAPIKLQEATPSGIVLPPNVDLAMGSARKGEVMAVGPGSLGKDGTRVPMSVNEGDVVLYPYPAGIRIESSGDDRLVLNETDILAIVL